MEGFIQKAFLLFCRYNISHFLSVNQSMWMILFCLWSGLECTAQVVPGKENLVKLEQWIAGEIIGAEVVAAFGLDLCFSIEQIDDALFHRIEGKSYRENCTVTRNELRYLKVLHYNRKGEICLGELICHQEISADLLQIFRTLYQHRYPIERMVLIDEYEADDELSMENNNTVCFNFRYISGTRILSKHSTGRAVDINPLYNPYVRTDAQGRMICRPATGQEYIDRNKKFDYKIEFNDLCVKEFIKRGFVWGGNWKTRKDYQHFEKPE